MQKQEFEERIERTVTDEQYKVIEEVYMWHPSILNTSGKARQQPQKRHTHQRDGAKKAAPPSIRLASL